MHLITPLRTLQVRSSGMLLAWLLLASATQAQRAFPDSLVLRPANLTSGLSQAQIVGSISPFQAGKEGKWSTSAGENTLVLTPAGGQPAEFKAFAHQSLELEFDVLLSDGAKAEVALQGSYLFKLNGSSSKTMATGMSHTGDFGTVGTEECCLTRPLQNVGRAPGLWQKVYIQFRAAEKDKPAELVRADANGSQIQSGFLFASPSEKSMGQNGMLTFRCTQGQMALRNVRFLKTDLAQAPYWTQLSYKTYDGKFDNFPKPDSAKVQSEGTAKGVDYRVSGKEDDFAIVYTGNLYSPKGGKQSLSVRAAGGMLMLVNGDTAIKRDYRYTVWGSQQEYPIKLRQGDNPMKMVVFKHKEGSPGLGIYATGQTFNQIPLHVAGSMADMQPPQPFILEAKGKPMVVRCFMTHKGKVMPYIVAVGTPAGIHYAYDISRGALIKVWKGDFLDVEGMWRSRGSDQLAIPRGAQVDLEAYPILQLSGGASPLDSLPTGKIVQKGYALVNGMPEFRYLVDGVRITDKITVTPAGRILREIASEKPVKGVSLLPVMADKGSWNGSQYVIQDQAIISAGSGTPSLKAKQNSTNDLLQIFDGTKPYNYEITF